MASINKLSRDRGKKGAPYYIQFFDHQGKRRTTRGCPDKGVTEAKAAKIETAVARLMLGLATAGELDALLGHQQSDAWRPQATKYEEGLRRKGNTAKYIKLVMARIHFVLEGAKFTTLAELDGDKAEEFLAERAVTDNLGNRTYNHYLQAIDAFGNWLAHPKRRLIERNPFAGLARRNIATDVRHPRRALKTEEAARLIQTARQSRYTWQGYDGPTRARIYLLSYMTGLRKGEIASLTPQSFRLDDAQPTIIVEAQYSKHRRKDVLPLHADLVTEVRGWIEGMTPDAVLFPKLDKRKGYTMVQRDLEEAGIPYETEEGLADFHAAGRHTHITELLRSGVSLVEAKELARHSDVRMTMKYTHIGLDDQAKAIAKLPAIPAAIAPAPEKDPREKGLHIVCDKSGAARQAGTPAVSHRLGKGRPQKRQNPRRSKGLDAVGQPMSEVNPNYQEVEAAGIEPASRDRSTGASTCVVS
jgi:integrase/recombinase XerC